MATATATSQTPMSAFMREMNAIEAALAAIRERFDAHFDFDPEAIHWGHVGSASHLRELLERAAAEAP